MFPKFHLLFFDWNFLPKSALILMTVGCVYCKPLQQQSNDRLTLDSGIYDAKSLSEMMTNSRKRNGMKPDLDKLARTMDALAQFRRVIDYRLLNNDNEGESDWRRRTVLDLDDLNERRTEKGQNKKSYSINGFNIKAHLEPASKRDEEDEEMKGGIWAQQFSIFSKLPQLDSECPRVHGKSTQVLCPSRGRHGYRVCIPDTALCDENVDCPNGEDERPINCLFYKTTIQHFRLVVDAVVELQDLLKEHEKDEL